MGEVYLAQDTKLDRKVALKILRRGRPTVVSFFSWSAM
jgi:serine/threonine protein kinase